MERPLLRLCTRSLQGITVGGARCGHRSHFRRKLQVRYRTYGRQTPDSRPPADFAFAFDIDGVLLRSSEPIPTATQTLLYLRANEIPFILLTNGGGKSEAERCRNLSKQLSIKIPEDIFMQSHTPFAELAAEYKDQTVLVVGGEGNKCREVAEGYGFKNVVIPGDIFIEYPEIWPMGTVFKDYYMKFVKKPPKAIDRRVSKQGLKIDAIFVFHDPRDWALDTQVIVDLLLSEEGYYGTLSHRNGERSLPNRGYQRHNQPPLFFSNPDLWWASNWHQSRLGQGGFREALEGTWAAITGGKENKVELQKKIIGKPYKETYEYAERLLIRHREAVLGADAPPLKRVYMIGDNPESDIRGANEFQSSRGIDWISILTRTGVYRGEAHGPPSYKPRKTADHVKAAVQWALRESDWHEKWR